METLRDSAGFAKAKSQLRDAGGPNALGEIHFSF